MSSKFAGKVVLICGASAGIGEATARAFARAGASTILVARGDQALRRLRDELGEGGTHSCMTCDLASSEAVERLCTSISALPRLDILINNSGGPPPKSPLETSVAEVQTALQSHLFAAMRLSQAAVPIMRRGTHGRIIHIVSVTARVPLVHLTASNIARGAVLAWTKTLAEALARDGITVNNVLPGYTATSRLTQLLADAASKRGITTDQAAAGLLQGIPAGRFATPEEVASAALYLASEDAAYITGINLPVDGGFIKTI
jgi:3-oxoacyl-[acyl-carrier protein] reductase